MITMKEAAERVGVTKSAIAQRIKTGKLSAKKNHLGHYQIDEAELLRSYPNYTGKQLPEVGNTTHQENIDSEKILIAELKAKLAATEKALEVSTRYAEGWEKRFNDSEKERQEAEARYHALLTDQREKKPKGLIQRIFG